MEKALGVLLAAVIAAPSIAVSSIRTSAASRAAYLAHAVVWHDPGVLSPADVLAGPPGLPYTSDQATSENGITCTYAQSGRELGGGTAKFLCRTSDGESRRFKYWNPETARGNREVFAAVVASRLIWTLGFNAVPTVSVNLTCANCPDNPHEGTGERRTRRYFAMVQAAWPTPVLLSGGDVDQGWSWKELDEAIRSLPPGAERVRQRMHFDALALLGVFMQHGDRKSEQQRLYCASDIDAAAGEIVAAKGTLARTMLLEQAGRSACATSTVMLADVGATFGGAGRTSSDSTAAMNLEEWTRKRVFDDASGSECRGELTVSLRAGEGGEGNPRVAEEGRVFLLEQLHRLTPEHVRAILKAARVDELRSRSSQQPDTIDAWVGAFQDKVRQIESRRCQPAR